MADLKAAAKRLRGLAKWRKESAFPELRSATRRQILEEADACILAAQALEAWAWQQETGACVRRKFAGNCWKWACYAPSGRSWFEYVADTPLGAVLAAMEGEKDGN